LRDLIEAIDPVDMGLERALGGPAQKLIHFGAGALGLPFSMGAPEHTLDIGTLEQHQIERQFWDLALREADDEVPALPGERPDSELAELAADWIINDIDTLLGQRAQRIFQILPLVVHGCIGAERTAEIELVVGRCASDDLSPHELADLDRRLADATCPPQYGECLPGFILARSFSA
jgi:hypothetical protein